MDLPQHLIKAGGACDYQQQIHELLLYLIRWIHDSQRHLTTQMFTVINSGEASWKIVEKNIRLFKISSGIVIKMLEKSGQIDPKMLEKSSQIYTV